MASVMIVKVPAGEAPLEVRKAWVGLTLPLSRGAAGSCSEYCANITSGSFAGRRQVYPVDAVTAIDILERQNPDAAAWWKNMGWYRHVDLLFDERQCQLVS
jgi:hypothetical protein